MSVRHTHVSHLPTSFHMSLPEWDLMALKRHLIYTMMTYSLFLYFSSFKVSYGPAAPYKGKRFFIHNNPILDKATEGAATAAVSVRRILSPIKTGEKEEERKSFLSLSDQPLSGPMASITAHKNSSLFILTSAGRPCRPCRYCCHSWTCS